MRIVKSVAVGLLAGGLTILLILAARAELTAVGVDFADRPHFLIQSVCMVATVWLVGLSIRAITPNPPRKPMSVQWGRLLALSAMIGAFSGVILIMLLILVSVLLGTEAGGWVRDMAPGTYGAIGICGWVMWVRSGAREAVEN